MFIRQNSALINGVALYLSIIIQNMTSKFCAVHTSKEKRIAKILLYMVIC